MRFVNKYNPNTSSFSYYQYYFIQKAIAEFGRGDVLFNDFSDDEDKEKIQNKILRNRLNYLSKDDSGPPSDADLLFMSQPIIVKQVDKLRSSVPVAPPPSVVTREVVNRKTGDVSLVPTDRALEPYESATLSKKGTLLPPIYTRHRQLSSFFRSR